MKKKQSLKKKATLVRVVLVDPEKLVIGRRLKINLKIWKMLFLKLVEMMVLIELMTVNKQIKKEI